jgi:hypothetical protein
MVPKHKNGDASHLDTPKKRSKVFYLSEKVKKYVSTNKIFWDSKRKTTLT